MYTNLAEMKIFATNVAAVSAADATAVAAAGAAITATTTQQQQLQQQQQQREYRCGAQLKYNNKYNNKANNNVLRQGKYNNSSNDNKQAKRQQQQHYNNHNNQNVHNFTRKKYFGSNANNNNSYNCNQQQSPYYQQQQQAATKNNNNNNMMKNQNIEEISCCKHSNDNNNNNSSSDSNNNSTNKSIKSNKSNSLSESSTSSAYYHSCSESSTTPTATNSSNNSSNNNSISSNTNDEQQQQGTPTTLESATSSKQSTAAMAQQQQDNSRKTQKSRQQPLSFWKTSYPQQPTLQQKEQQLKAALATQKETELAMAAAATAGAAAAAEGGGASDQQQHYYPYYYSHPKQLTIASFLQKELLPEADKASQQQQQQKPQQQPQSGAYQQRYRNYNYNNNNNYQQQQQQSHAQQQHHNQNHMHNTHFRRNKKLNYNSNNNCTPATGAQKSIEILPASNYNATHRRMQNANAAGGAGSSAANNTNHIAGSKNGYYQLHHQHPHHYHQHTLMGGNSGTPTRSEHQNLYNLTYVNMDVPQPSPTATAAATVAATTSKPAATTAATTKTEAASAGKTATTVAASSAATSNRNLFLQVPPTLQMAMLGPGLLSPVALTPDTPTNMISCAQLDEAITAAAASSNKHVEPSAILAVHSPSYAALPFMLHQQQQPQQQQQLYPNKTQQQQPHFVGFGDGYSNAAWSHGPNSPCYSTAYGPGPGSISSGSAHSRIPSHRAVSPASSTCSLASESQWSNRSRFNSTELLSVSPTPPATGATAASGTGTGTGAGTSQPSTSPHLGNMGNMQGMLPVCVPQMPPPPMHLHNMHMGGPYQHYCVPNCMCGSNVASWPPSWYEVVLPPDRYLDYARNVELTMQPDQLLCHCKYDNLSLDIWKRFRGAQQTHHKFKLKMRLWRYLFICINTIFSGYRICLVGSTITGFGTDSSDIDMCLVPETSSHQHHQLHQHHYYNELRTRAIMILNLFDAVLKEMADVFQDFHLIEARVPILRFKDRINGIEVDLNYNNSVGIKNTYLLQLYAQLDWRTRPLVVIVKLWAQYHDINDAKRMTVSSYSLVLMVLHYLQAGCVPHVLPCLQALYPEKFNLGQQECLDLDLIEPIEPYQTHNTQTLGEHLLGFFKYFSNFDFLNHAISVRTGGILPVHVCRHAKSPKNDLHQWKELNIEEPFDLSNTARSVYDSVTFERVKAIFMASAHRLEHTLDLASIFAPIHYNAQRAPMRQPTQHHIHSHPLYNNHRPYYAQQPHQHLMHARGSTYNTPAKMVPAGNYGVPTTHII